MDDDVAFQRAKDAIQAEDPRRVRLSLSGWASVTPEDLEQFRQQATWDAGMYRDRERLTLMRTFEGLAAMAASELGDRAAGDEPALWLTVTATLDETAGDEANKDDVATLMARALYWYDHGDTRLGTSNLWGRVIAELTTNREHLRALGLVL